ncbi:MAG: TIGR02452 family protein [Thiolinea sp.]
MSEVGEHKVNRNINQLSQTITRLPPAQMADLLEAMGTNVLFKANQYLNQNIRNGGHLTACSKHLEQAAREILRFAQYQQADDKKYNGMKNNNMNRLKRVQIAQDTLSIIKQGCYQHEQSGTVDLRAGIDACIKQTRLFTPDQLADLCPELPVHETQIEVMNETTLEGAQRLYERGGFKRIAVLNFASAKNAGGGFLGGSQAQEESLARSSALYASLQECPEYYDYHRRQNKSLLYSDHMIYSPSCPVFRLDDGELLAEPYAVDFITSPAPNRGALARNQPAALGQLESIFISRIRAVLKLAAAQGCGALVLGAWGCGVFGNQPQAVAAWFAAQLSGEGEFANSFRHVSFSIPEDPRTATNNLSFKQAFAK